MRPRKKTREHLVRHAQTRLMERYGLHISETELLTLSRRSRHNDLVIIGRQSNTRTWVLVPIEGMWLPAVYDKRLSCICTFLLWDWLTEDALNKLREVTIEGEALVWAWHHRKDTCSV